MKKHDEGYVLALVMVVIVVLCLIASAILSGALYNINTQHDQIADMQERYAAAGKIEILVSQLEKKATWAGIPGNDQDAVGEKIKSLCGNAEETGMKLYEGAEGDEENLKWSPNGTDNLYTFQIIAQSGEMEIVTKLELTLTIYGSDVSAAKLRYLQYETKTIEGGAPDAE